MPALLSHTDCPACGHRHHFCLPAGDLSPGRAYGFVCPETGRPADLRPPAAAVRVPHYPQGAVSLGAAIGQRRAA